jgi:K+-transporting ATPase ATPase A chain
MMTPHAWLLLGLFLLVLLALVKPLGIYIANVMEGHPWFGAASRGSDRVGDLSPWWRPQDEEMGWLHYALAILLFNGWACSPSMPCNGSSSGCRSIRSRWPTSAPIRRSTPPSASSPTPTGKATRRDDHELPHADAGLTVQNFLSAATGIVVVIALIRGFARHTAKSIGNAWVDLTRITLYVLLPLSLVFAVFLVSQGVIQNFALIRT